MWICSRCQTANKEGYGQCVSCSAPRNARRFGAGTPVNAPSIQTAAPERRMSPPQSENEALPQYRRQTRPQPAAKSAPPAGGFVRLIGLNLSVLLPLLVLVAGVIYHDRLMSFLPSLFANPELASGFGGYFVYGLLCLLAAIISLVPGLSLFALGHIMRGLVQRK